MFAIDIAVGFMTSYVDCKTGDEIYDLRKIAHNYIFEGDFDVDFLSTVDVIGFASTIFRFTISSTLQQV